MHELILLFNVVFLSFVNCRASPDLVRPSVGSLRHRGRGRSHRPQDLGRHHELPELGLRGHCQGLSGLRNSQAAETAGKNPRFFFNI